MKSISLGCLPLDRLEVLDGAGAAEVEEVLAHAAVAGAAALAASEVGEPVLDSDALAELRSAGAGLCSLRSLCWSRSFSAMATVRPLPALAAVQFARKRQWSHASGSNSTGALARAILATTVRPVGS